MLFFLLFSQVEVDSALDTQLTEGNPFLQQCTDAQHARCAANQDVKIAGKAVLERCEAVELLHQQIRVDTAL